MLFSSKRSTMYKSDRIFHAIRFNQVTMGLDLAWIEELNECLSDETKRYIDNGNYDLRILAEVIKETFDEIDCKSDIEKILNNKLHDQNLMLRKKAKYDNKRLK